LGKKGELEGVRLFPVGRGWTFVEDAKPTQIQKGGKRKRGKTVCSIPNEDSGKRGGGKADARSILPWGRRRKEQLNETTSNTGRREKRGGSRPERIPFAALVGRKGVKAKGFLLNFGKKGGEGGKGADIDLRAGYLSYKGKRKKKIQPVPRCGSGKGYEVANGKRGKWERL